MSSNLYIAIVIISLSEVLVGQNICYDTSKVGLLLNYRELKRELIFERYDLLTRTDSAFIRMHQPSWRFVRGAANTPLDDIGFLRYVEMRREADLLMAEREKEIKRKMWQMAISVPVGFMLSSVGGWWLASSGGSKDKLDYVAGSVLLLSGIGIAYAGIFEYISSKRPNYFKHKITYIQALDLVDRYNKLLNTRCRKE